ncbi:MAG: 2-C-methyl-D-erythritol 4-phosphate cytidylyltransferase [Tannerellaceae bacterium]|jgi:2-C-methyl-D-erythritol 4-phosphate cytidylyltransferase|nr:2-C-methyl-D-erythritol 4-phosphate cytidylyltransferase [Tannerellaceae bacterium]
MKRYALIVAGGKGLRMGNELPKQFMPLKGRPVLMHTLECFYRWDTSAEIILVLPGTHQPYWNMLCNELNCRIPHKLANGGETRFHSVQHGLSLVSEPGLVAVHDGVRPFVSAEVIENCFTEAERSGAVIPVVPFADSIREKYEPGLSRAVDRQRFVAVQTPQVFRSDWLLDAYGQAYTPGFTDDASVVEAKGFSIALAPGNRENIKLTTPFDLWVAEAYIQNQAK